MRPVMCSTNLLKILLRFTLPMLGRMAIPVAGIAIQGVVMALLEWDRKSEFSSIVPAYYAFKADAAYHTSETAGGGAVREMNIDAFVRRPKNMKHRERCVTVHSNL